MAQTDNTVSPAEVDPNKTYWCASMYSNDADTTGNLTVKADPSSGNLFVEHIIIAADCDCGKVQINDGTDALFGPFELTATEWGGFIDINLKHPIKLAGALKVDAGTNGVVNVIAEGYTA